MRRIAAVSLAVLLAASSGLAASPAVDAMRALETQRVEAGKSFTTAGDSAAQCAALDALVALTWREHTLMASYMAANGPDDSAMSVRKTHEAVIDRAMVDGPPVWAARCAGDFPDKVHATWDEANTDFQSELVRMQGIATKAYNASEAGQYDQVCVPLRHSIAMLVHVRGRLDEMDRLAAGDQDHRDRDITYRNAIDETLGKITPDGAEACASGVYTPIMVKHRIDGSRDVMIPQPLADQLDAHDKKRQDYADRYRRFKAQLGPDMDSEVQSNICADMTIMWESEQGEIRELTIMADLARNYPDLAKTYTDAIDAINEANYGIGAPICGS